MIEQIDAMTDLGLFASCEYDAACAWQDVTLVYGENGVGKTTLAAMLDSVRSGDPRLMLRRARLGSAAMPMAAMTIGGHTYAFDGSAWDSRPPDDTLDVFYSEFITRNVYSGEKIDSDQRRQLCEFALGPKALQTMSRLQKATEASGAALKEIQRIERLLTDLVKKPHSIEQFEALDPRIDVAERVELARKQLEAAKRVAEELQRQAPGEVSLPEIPRNKIGAFLAMSTSDISADAAATVRQHIASRLDMQRGEEWLAYGAAHLAERCPFCDQSVDGLKLTDAIAAFFSDKYRDYAASVRADAEALKTEIGTAAIDPIVADLTREVSVAGKWEEQHKIDTTGLSATVNQAAAEWRRAAQGLGALVAKKLASPLDAIEIMEATEALKQYSTATALFAEVNRAIAASRTAVDAYKKALSTADTAELQLALNRVENEAARSQPYANELLTDWRGAKAERKRQETARDTLKQEFESHAKRVIGTYQAAINHYLRAFGCDMEIKEVKAAFPAGKASVAYELHVRGHGIPLGYHVDQPCFQTALSEGDRCSLGLAFFMARMKDHKSLAGRAVVLDDPVDSFGTLRLRAVRLAIRDLSARGAQVVILTHDDRLAAMIWRDSSKGAMNKRSFVALEVVESSGDASMRPWDVERATRGQYFNDFAMLQDLLGDRIDHTVAVRAIRPYLEARLRYRYPGSAFTTRDNLGDMIGKVRNAGRGSVLKELEPSLRDLEELNDASLPSHHASDDAIDMPMPTRKATRRYAEMALSIC